MYISPLPHLDAAYSPTIIFFLSLSPSLSHFINVLSANSEKYLPYPLAAGEKNKISIIVFLLGNPEVK